MRCVPLVGSLHPQFSATAPGRLDFSNGSANGTITLDLSPCTTLTSSWQVSARKAGLPAVWPPNARRSDPSLVMRKPEVGVFPVFRSAFVVREFQNMKIGQRDQRGRTPE